MKPPIYTEQKGYDIRWGRQFHDTLLPRDPSRNAADATYRDYRQLTAKGRERPRQSTVTPWRLVNTTFILTFATWKWRAAKREEPTANDLDLAIGLAWAVMYVAIIVIIYLSSSTVLKGSA
ncbi:hypothetical protein NMY22_g16246 [Coprinellus aureogranulatus]|nr:hypothetical protein NMY22_g16246 [Coprinellus aureogranulatus]